MSKEDDEIIAEVWITKYVLTEGITKREGVRRCLSSDAPEMIVTRDKYAEFFHGEGREWHRTQESARRRARDMCEKKLVSLAKKYEKIEERLKEYSVEGEG